MRHIVIIGPAMLLLGGIGIAYVSDVLYEKIGYRPIKYILSFLLFMIIVGSSAIHLREIYVKNSEYVFIGNYYNNPDTYRDAAEIIREVSGRELKKYPKIIARKQYIAYYAEGERVLTPYTDYNGFVKYCKLNNADFLYLEHEPLFSYPFLEVFRGRKPHPDFILLHEKRDPYNNLIQLFRFIQSPADNMVLGRGSSNQADQIHNSIIINNNGRGNDEKQERICDVGSKVGHGRYVL
jgi:hypothetical protein